jgi:hypothetical protein
MDTVRRSGAAAPGAAALGRVADSGAAERWVGWGTVVCGVHCVASPALALVVPAIALGELVERGVLLALLPWSVWLVWRGFRSHRRWAPCIMVAAGVLCWLAAVLEPAGPGVTQAAFIGAGGAFTFAGLRWGRREQQACGCNGCDAG